MKKTGLWIVVIAATIASLFISCSNAGQTADDAINAVGYVRFGNQKTRDLNPSYEIQGYENLYWFYDAQKNDEYGKTGEGTNFKIPGNSETGKGLDGQVGPFSQGSWIFTLKAYTSATEDTGTWTPDTATLVYEGKTEPVTIKGGEVKNIPVSVEPVGAFGTVKFGDDAYFTWAKEGGGNTAPNIKFTFTKTEGDAEPVVVNVTLGEKTVDGKFMLTGKLPVDGQLPAGFYTCTVIAYIPGNESTPLTTQTFSFRVYGNATTIINGSITEGVDSYVSFDVEETEMNVFQAETSGPTTVEVSVTPEKTENKTSVEFPAGALDTDGTFFLEVGVTSSSAAPESFKVTGTDADGKVAVAGINLSLTKVTSVDGSTSQEGITSFNEQEVIVTTYISTGLDASTIEVYYDNNTDNHEKMTVDSYNSATGELKFKTTHFSSFYVVAKCEALNENLGRGYSTVEEAFAAAADGHTIKLLSNAVLGDASYVKAGETISVVEIINKAVTLDLAGFSIVAGDDYKHDGGLFLLGEGGSLTINDSSPNGTGMIDVTRRINPITPDIYSCVVLTTENVSKNGPTLVVNGGTLKAPVFTIGGNASKSTVNNATSIVINGGKVISTYGDAIFNSQIGKIVINDGYIEGADAAIEIRAGELVINNGSFVSTVTSDAVWESKPENAGSGNTFGGSAIVVSQHGYKPDIDITINNGSFSGYYCLYEKNIIQNNPPANVSISITNGDFDGLIYSGDCTGFISGGIFNNQLDEAYIAPGYTAEDSSDNWTVESIFAGGDGTISNPFVIKTKEQFASLKEFSEAADMAWNEDSYYYFDVVDDLDFTGYGEFGYIPFFRGEIDFNGHVLSGLSEENINYSSIIDTLIEGGIENLIYQPTDPIALAYCAAWNSSYHLVKDGAEVFLRNIQVGSETDRKIFDGIGNNFSMFIFQVLGTNTHLTLENCTNYYSAINGNEYNGVFLGGYASKGARVDFINCDNYGTFYGPKLGYLIGNDNNTGVKSVTAKDCNNYGELYGSLRADFVCYDHDGGTCDVYDVYEDKGGNTAGTIAVLQSVDATVKMADDSVTIESILINNSADFDKFEIVASGYATMYSPSDENAGTLLLRVSSGVKEKSGLSNIGFRKIGFINKEKASSTIDYENYSIAEYNGKSYYAIDLKAEELAGGMTVDFAQDGILDASQVKYTLYLYKIEEGLDKLAGSYSIK